MSDTLSKVLTKPVLAGASAAALSWLVFGASPSATATVAGFTVPRLVLLGGVVGGASFAADFVARYGLPYLNENTTAGQLGAKILKPLATGGGVALYNLAMESTSVGTESKLVALGAAAEVCGQWAAGIVQRYLGAQHSM